MSKVKIVLVEAFFESLACDPNVCVFLCVYLSDGGLIYNIFGQALATKGANFILFTIAFSFIFYWFQIV